MGIMEKLEIIKRLSQFVQKGVVLYLEGRLSTPEEVAECYCVNEDSIYMADYVLSEGGSLKEVRYDKIRYV